MKKETRGLALQLAVKMYPEYVRDMCQLSGYELGVAHVLSIERVGPLSELTAKVNDAALLYISCWKSLILTLKRSEELNSDELLGLLSLQLEPLLDANSLAELALNNLLIAQLVEINSLDALVLVGKQDKSNITIREWLFAYTILNGMSIHSGKAPYRLNVPKQREYNGWHNVLRHLVVERDPRLITILEEFASSALVAIHSGGYKGP